MSKLLAGVGGFVAIILIAVLSGFVIKTMWGWFIAPTFGLPGLSIPIAIGISFLVSYLTYSGESTSDQGLVEILVVGFIRCIFYLAFGWIIHLFV